MIESYAAPTVETPMDYYLEESEVPVFVAAIGWVLLVFGSAWVYCQAMCGWMNVRECETSWLKVRAVCKG